MSEESIKFNNKKFNKSDFYKTNEIFKIDDIDVNKISVSKKNHVAQK